MADEIAPSYMKSSDTRITGNYSDYAKDSEFINKRGDARTFDADKYKVEQYTYPDNLLSPTGEYGGNYAIFYINVSEDSKLIKRDGLETVDDVSPRERGEAIATVQRNGQGAAMAAAGPLTALLGGSSILGGGAFGTAAAGVGAYGVAKTASNFQAATKRLKTAIALHMPNNMTIRYGVNYEEQETMLESMLGTALGNSVSFAKAAENKSMDDIVSDAVSQLTGESARSAVTALALKAPGTGIASKLTGLAPNPRKEQIFRNVDVRTFQIDYQFFPRDEKESQYVKNIIKQFKLHMHPEYKDANAFLYIYPSEFDIYYYTGGKENLNIHRHTSCVLTEMNINYTPQGRFNSFSDGTPTQINIFLTFRELVPLTKERIEDGF